MIFFLIWLAGAVGVGAIARGRNRSFVGFFLISVILSPLCGLIAVLLSKPGGKKCPACAETVKMEAKKCRHCGYELLGFDKTPAKSGEDGTNVF